MTLKFYLDICSVSKSKENKFVENYVVFGWFTRLTA